VKRHNALILTFDDGPGTRLTPAILAILADHNVKATFFLLGKNIPGREAIVQQIATSGHEIGSHGYEHLHYWAVSPFRSVRDVKRGWQMINAALGVSKSTYAFRPPYGKLNLICLLYLWWHKVPIVYWTFDTGDTWPSKKQNTRRITALDSYSEGAVVLAHDFDRADIHVGDMVLDLLNEALSIAKKNNMAITTISGLHQMD
jgi:peptidoglycan/xylan/chitin deacetylase (PgdA/CDA1 family)